MEAMARTNVKRGKTTSLRRTRLGRRVGRAINSGLLFLVAMTMLYPFIQIFLKSFMTDTDIINQGGFFVWPNTSQMEGYKSIFEADSVYNVGHAFLISVFVTAATTSYQLTITTLAAYGLSKRFLPGKKFFYAFFIFTMYFGGGLIPYFILIRQLGLLNQIWVLIIPQFISVPNLLVMKSFFDNFPSEVIEAAKVDGCSNWRTFISIVLPLSKAVLATIALFVAVGVWNNWFTTMLFIQDPDLRPLAYVVQVIIDMSVGRNTQDGQTVQLIGKSIQYAAIIVSTVPIVLVYPFLQKYFEKGVMIGSIKG